MRVIILIMFIFSAYDGISQADTGATPKHSIGLSIDIFNSDGADLDYRYKFGSVYESVLSGSAGYSSFFGWQYHIGLGVNRDFLSQEEYRLYGGVALTRHHNKFGFTDDTDPQMISIEAINEWRLGGVLGAEYFIGRQASIFTEFDILSWRLNDDPLGLSDEFNLLGPVSIGLRIKF